jgi:hypothetical protein
LWQSLLTVRCTRLGTFHQYKVEEPYGVHFAQIYFCGMTFNEVDNLVLVEAVNVVPVAVVLLPALNPVAEPTRCKPFLNLVVVFTKAKLKIADCVAVGDASAR